MASTVTLVQGAPGTHLEHTEIMGWRGGQKEMIASTQGMGFQNLTTVMLLTGAGAVVLWVKDENFVWIL